MADFSQIKALIDEKILDNQQQAITGLALNETLKGMVDAVNNLKSDKIPVASFIPDGGMLPNVYYDLGTIASASFPMADPETGKASLYMFKFNNPFNSLTFDEMITAWWNEDNSFVSGHTYEVYVVNGLATKVDWGTY